MVPLSILVICPFAALLLLLAVAVQAKRIAAAVGVPVMTSEQRLPRHWRARTKRLGSTDARREEMEKVAEEGSLKGGNEIIVHASGLDFTSGNRH